MCRLFKYQIGVEWNYMCSSEKTNEKAPKNVRSRFVSLSLRMVSAASLA